MQKLLFNTVCINAYAGVAFYLVLQAVAKFWTESEDRDSSSFLIHIFSILIIVS